MSEAVLQYDGVVTETLGDGILALFGTPKPLEDHPVRACLAALSDAGESLFAEGPGRSDPGRHTLGRSNRESR